MTSTLPTAPMTNDPLTAALGSLPETRRQILELLKRRGEADTESIATALEITPSGARQHLTALANDGLVTFRADRTGPGRPRHLHALTAAGDALFPRNYVDLTNELLEYVEDEDPALLQRIFDRRAQRRRSLLSRQGQTRRPDPRRRRLPRRLRRAPRRQFLDHGAQLRRARRGATVSPRLLDGAGVLAGAVAGGGGDAGG